MEGLSDPGGICISRTAFDHIESKLPYGYEFMGDQTIKNIARPVGAYRVLMEPRVTVAEGIEKEKKNAELISAIISMAHNLNKKVIAEGVEKPEQLDFLSARDCDAVQGFLLGRPSTIDHVIESLSPVESASMRNKLTH